MIKILIFKIIIVSLIFSAGWTGGALWNEIGHYENDNRTL